jgi:DNA repair exonuclease SbcCD nuclease subunit
LERPLYGLAEAPESLRELLIEAPYRAARRVFDAALSENVDLVILAGDVVAPQLSGPRGLAFLTEQFTRLAERGIAVYWAAGSVDAIDQWSAPIDWPEVVHTFAGGQPRQMVHLQGSEPAARIIGAGYQRGGKIAAGDMRPDPEGLFTIGVAFGRVTPELLKQQRIGYLALGGRHDRFTCSTGAHGAHFPGTPQGRCPDESGPHGCTIVQVDETGRTRTRFIATDAVRWIRERVILQTPVGRGELEELLAQRVASLLERVGDLDVLISWRIGGPGLASLPGSRESNSAARLEKLRRRFGTESPVAWSASLVVEPPLPRGVDEEDTIAADLVKLVREYEQDAGRILEFSALLPETKAAVVLKDANRISGPGGRQAVLAQIGRLGLDLLAPMSRDSENQDEVEP